MIQTAFLGDVVLTTPLLSALAGRYGAVDVVTTPAAASLLETHPAVRSVIRYDKRGAARGWRGLWQLGAELRQRGYQRVYLPHRSWRSAALAVLARVPERVGFADSPAAISYTARIPRARSGHEVDRLLGLVGAAASAAPPVDLGLTAADHAEAESWLASRGVAPGFVALAPGSIWGTKRWPYYAALAAALPGDIVVVGGPEDAPLAEAVAAAAGEWAHGAAGKVGHAAAGEATKAATRKRAHSAAGALSLRGSAALIQRSAVLVTNDSAPLHLATAVKTPVVAIFGPTVPEFGFGPRGAGDVVIGHQALDCRPCSAHGPRVCPRGHHRCMRELTVHAVVAAVTRVTAGAA